ncbi:ribosome biogenesis GTPase YlqF [Paraferrimonas sedimenticola]|uniref:Ribosome biogenesis GTPase A n=1 Tax=Paraferrimonas sedimenticola TaxID=375674 RepID=A0AA37RZP9_9GAMM|nr:ribosome biogenesis GTPase YlqF [Paraferrimonas sedimenticola]GLP97904.1 ribosome biogenesis GTPase A [Paraferrimonas sedimenticola]
MAIQWYPGHMHKARKQIEEVMPQVDLVIEVLDARIPYSSENPMVSQLRGDTPCIKLLNKSDLADPEITQLWLDHFDAQKGVKAMAITTSDLNQVNKIPDLCRKLSPHRDQPDKAIRTMIMGIPNVGKSTLINTLAGRIIAKTGNEPAVTKRQQRISLKNGIVLSDTPGILWPKVENENSGYRLAVTGAIRDTAMEYEDVAMYGVEYLMQAYPERLAERYNIDDMDQEPIQILEEIGRRRGALRAGGRIDYHKASEVLLHELRGGKLGLITLETPEMIEREEVIVEEQREAKRIRDEERKEHYKNKKRRR